MAGEVKAEVSLLREGMDVLMEGLGPEGAVRFIAMLGGRGDSVKELRRARKGTTVDEVMERVLAHRAKERGTRT